MRDRRTPAQSIRKRSNGCRGGSEGRARADINARPQSPERTALVEQQDRASDLAGLHRAKRLVDILQAAAPRDHLVELEAALAVVVDVSRHVHLEAVRAHAAALHFFLAQ